LRTLEEYQWSDGNCALWGRRGRCRGGWFNGSQLDPSIAVIFACAAAPCVLTLACVGRADRQSRKCRIGEFKFCRVGRLEYHDILHNGDSRRKRYDETGVREYREKKEREENKREWNKE
jgi:hypothetical protein